MTWSKFWLILHILSVIIGLGPTFAYGLIGAQAGKHPQHALFATELIEFIAFRLTYPGLVLIPLTGTLMIFTAHIDLWESEWLIIAIPLFTIAFFYAALVQTPTGLKMIKVMKAMPPRPPPEGTTGPPPELARLIKRSAIGGVFLALLIVAAVVLMIWKPGHEGGLVV